MPLEAVHPPPPRRFSLRAVPPTIWYVAAAFALILGSDVVYQARGIYRPPVFDARLYQTKARWLLHEVGEVVPPLRRRFALPHGTPADSAGGRAGMIRWIAAQGPSYPVYLAAAGLVLGTNPPGERRANTLLHLGSALLVWRLGVLVASPVVGLVGLTLFALYLPFTYMTSQLLTENLAAFLVLLAVFLALSFLRRQGGRGTLMVASLYGLCLVLLALCRPALAPLAPVMLAIWAGVILWRWRRHRHPGLLAGLAVALVCAGLPYLAWQQAVTSAYHLDRLTFSVTGPRPVAASLAESYDWRNAGWPRPAALSEGGGVSAKLVPPWKSIRSAPWASVRLRLEKLYRLWKSPATAYGNPLWGGNGPVNALHVALLGGALVGLLGAPAAPAWILAMLPVAYTTVLYTGFFSEERRFTFPVMGLVILFAAVAAISAWERIRHRGPGPRLTRWDLTWIFALVLGGAYLAHGAFVLFPGESAGKAHAFLVILFTAALSVGVWRVTGALWGASPPPHFQLRRLAATVVLALPIGVHLFHYVDWYSWKVVLKDPSQRLVQEIALTPGFDWRRVVAANLQIDARDRDGRLDDLKVMVNGWPAPLLVRTERLPDPIRYAVKNLAPLRPNLDWSRLSVAPGLPQWLIYRLIPAQLAGADRVIVTLQLRPGAANGYTEVYGELPSDAPDLQLGPRPWLLLTDKPYVRTAPFSGRNSLWRYQTYGDMRLRGGTRLAGTHRSAYMHGNAPPAVGPDADLSDAPLLQTGSYRIRLQLITGDGRELFF